jgi:uncharacterized repeat protein (TIGR01451 family)/fimbrial isopeptide formation D2 family protein
MGNESDERFENRTDQAPLYVTTTVNISKTPDCPRNAAIGESVNFTIFVDLPNATLYNVTVNDTLPRGFIYNSSSFEMVANNDSFGEAVSTPNNGSAPVHVNWTLGTVNNSNNRDITINLDITINFNATIADVPGNQNGTVLNNSAIFNWVDYNGAEGNVSDESGNITITENEADLSITLSDSPDPVTAGKYLWYEINVTNNGPDYAYNVSVTDALPDAVTFSSASPAPNGSTRIIYRWNFTGIEANNSILIKICVVTGATGLLDNTVNVTSATHDPNETNNVDTEYTTVRGGGGGGGGGGSDSHTDSYDDSTPDEQEQIDGTDPNDPDTGDGTRRHPPAGTNDRRIPGQNDRRIPDELIIPFIAFIFFAIPLILFRVDVVDNGELSPADMSMLRSTVYIPEGVKLGKVLPGGIVRANADRKLCTYLCETYDIPPASAKAITIALGQGVLARVILQDERAYDLAIKMGLNAFKRR